MVPIDRDISHDAARLYCKRLAQRLEATDPARYTTSSAPAKRNKRIYIDYLRNGRGTTAVGAYSPRAREGFPVAAPVTWAQVERGIHPDAFTIARPPPMARGRKGRPALRYKPWPGLRLAEDWDRRWRFSDTPRRPRRIAGPDCVRRLWQGR